jgi:hypothetical protein
MLTKEMTEFILTSDLPACVELRRVLDDHIRQICEIVDKIEYDNPAIRNQVKMGMANPQAGQQNMTQTENENDTTSRNTQVAAA